MKKKHKRQLRQLREEVARLTDYAQHLQDVALEHAVLLNELQREVNPMPPFVDGMLETSESKEQP